MKRNIFDNLYVVIGIPCLFMMMVTSRGFTNIKTTLLVATIIISVLEIIITHSRFNKRDFFYLFGFIIYYMFSLLWGIIGGYPFSFNIDFSLIQYYAITPIAIYLGYMIFRDKPSRTKLLVQAVTIISLFIVIMDVWKLLAYENVLPDIDKFNLIMVASDNMYDDKLALRVSNEHVLMYLLPFYIIMLLDPKCDNKKRIIYSFIILLGCIYAIISGRKMLELAIIMMVIYMIIIKQRYDLFYKITIAVVILVIVGNKVSELLGVKSIFLMAKNTLEAGLSGNANGVITRKEDTRALFDMWLNSPLWGNGLNSYSDVSIANSTTKWSYEVVYTALLAQTGIIGIWLLLIGVVHILKVNLKLFRLTNVYIYFASFWAFLIFFLAGSSNPFVYTAWPWVLSLALGREKGLKPLYEEDNNNIKENISQVFSNQN